MASTGPKQKLSDFKNESVEYVAEWLERNKLQKLKPVFEENDIDGDAFILLGDCNLRNMIKSEGLYVKFKKAFDEQFCSDKCEEKSANDTVDTMQEKQKQKFLDEDFIKENSKIYGRGTQKPITAWQNAVNEAAHEIVQNNHNLLYDRASLKFQAEARARETYIFKKRSGSRSKLTQSDSEQQVKRTKLNQSQRVTLLSSLSEQLVSVKKQIEITEKHISRSTAISDFDSCSKAHVQLRKLLAEKQSLQPL